MSARPTERTARLKPGSRDLYGIGRAEAWIAGIVRDHPGGRVVAFPVRQIFASPMSKQSGLRKAAAVVRFPDQPDSPREDAA